MKINGKDYLILKTSAHGSVKPSNLGPIAELFKTNTQDQPHSFNSDSYLYIRFINAQNGANMAFLTPNLKTIVYVQSVHNQVRMIGDLKAASMTNSKIYDSKTSLNPLGNSNLVLNRVIPLVPNLIRQTVPTRAFIPRNYVIKFKFTPFSAPALSQMDNIFRYSSSLTDKSNYMLAAWYSSDYSRKLISIGTQTRLEQDNYMSNLE